LTALLTVSARPLLPLPPFGLSLPRNTGLNTIPSHATPLHLRMHDLQRICALQSVAGEGMTYDEYHAAVEEFASDLTPMEMSAVIRRLRFEDNCTFHSLLEFVQ
jgi:hypothetical protein